MAEDHGSLERVGSSPTLGIFIGRVAQLARASRLSTPLDFLWTTSSTAEHRVYIAEATGSNPVSSTKNNLTGQAEKASCSNQDAPTNSGLERCAELARHRSRKAGLVYRDCGFKSHPLRHPSLKLRNGYNLKVICLNFRRKIKKNLKT